MQETLHAKFSLISPRLGLLFASAVANYGALNLSKSSCVRLTSRAAEEWLTAEDCLAFGYGRGLQYHHHLA
jgi:hypothetical protein